MISLHGLLNCKIRVGGLDCHVITTACLLYTHVTPPL